MREGWIVLIPGITREKVIVDYEVYRRDSEVELGMDGFGVR
jgi:hypothetical protein